MGKLISFSIGFSSELSPAALLESLLKSDFISFVCPKIGRVVVDENPLDFGVKDSTGREEQYRGEQIIAQGITALARYPDATQEIINFLARFPQANKCAANFFGDTLLEYVKEANVTRGKISRYGSENSYLPIVSCRVSRFRSTLIGVVVPCPMFFLKYWWPEDGLPRYSTPETAEHNWDSLIDAVQAIINTAGTSELQETGLSIEGSAPYAEREWLIAKAQRLPKLGVDFA